MWRSVVDGSSNYQIKRLRKFDSTFQQVVKKHYRKDKKNLKRFIETVERHIELELAVEPCDTSVSDAEPFPKTSAVEGFELRKKRWRNLPGLQGKSKYGRLIFLVDKAAMIVYLVWFYTHAEFPSRPPDKSLKIEISQITNTQD